MEDQFMKRFADNSKELICHKPIKTAIVKKKGPIRAT